MARKILITAGDVQMQAELNETRTAEMVWNAVPFENEGRTWGDEIYFPIDVDAPEENAQPTVPSGTIAYWPPGKCFCVFFGQTPASAVNPIGRLLGEPTEFKKVASGTLVRVTKAAD